MPDLVSPQVIGTAANVAMVVIWLIYLQIFLVAYLRQRRSAIHIDRGAAKDETARCIVTNMGQEPVYLVAVIVDFGQESGTSRAVVTDRDEVGSDEVSRPLERTTQGPLVQGEARDIGSLADLMHRARAHLSRQVDRDDVRCMTVTALAISNQGTHLVAACKDFSADHRPDGTTQFVPDRVLTRQIRSRMRRRRLLALIDDRDEV